MLYLWSILCVAAFARPVVDDGKAIRDLQVRLRETTSENDHFELEIQLARKLNSRPLDADQVDNARDLAQGLLYEAESRQQQTNYGDAVHQGHVLLGRVFLRSGNVNSAKRQLEIAAATPGSVLLKSSGPNMMLAKELLQKGERRAVIHFLEACEHFWDHKAQDERVRAWKQQIDAGQVPDFGVALRN